MARIHHWLTSNADRPGLGEERDAAVGEEERPGAPGVTVAAVDGTAIRARDVTAGAAEVAVVDRPLFHPGQSMDIHWTCGIATTQVLRKAQVAPSGQKTVAWWRPLVLCHMKPQIFLDGM